jgi:REP element-mobilizing transposase RayT
MSEIPILYTRNLPHIQPEDKIFFVTFRLHDSIPVSLVNQLRLQLKEEILKASKLPKSSETTYNLNKKFYAKYDELLDRETTGPHWLKDPNIAKICQNVFHEWDNEKYELYSYCIMSNHIHIVFKPTTKFLRMLSSKYESFNPQKILSVTTRIMYEIKKRTALLSNSKLGRTGKFWHTESYDHFVRDENELLRIILYVLNNPVKAKIVEDWRSYRWSFVREDYLKYFV